MPVAMVPRITRIPVVMHNLTSVSNNCERYVFISGSFLFYSWE